MAQAQVLVSDAASTENTLSTIGHVLASLQKLAWRLMLGRAPTEPVSPAEGYATELNAHLPPVLSFPGWGIYFFWQLGVMEYLMQHFDLSDVDMIGSSGGSFIGPFAKCGVDARHAAKLTHDLTIQHNIWSRPWGLLGVWGGLVHEWLQQLLPDDAAAKCGSTVGVVVCSVPAFRSHTIREFDSKADLVQVLLASAHVPFVLDLRPAARCRDGWALDGSFTYVVSGHCSHLVPVTKLNAAAVTKRVAKAVDEPAIKSACAVARQDAAHAAAGRAAEQSADTSDDLAEVKQSAAVLAVPIQTLQSQLHSAASSGQGVQGGGHVQAQPATADSSNTERREAVSSGFPSSGQLSSDASATHTPPNGSSESGTTSVDESSTHNSENESFGLLRRRPRQPPGRDGRFSNFAGTDQDMAAAEGAQDGKQRQHGKHQQGKSKTQTGIATEQPADASIVAVVSHPVDDVEVPPVLVFDPRMDAKLRETFTIARCLNLLSLEGAYALMDAGVLYAEALRKRGAFDALPQLS